MNKVALRPRSVVQRRLSCLGCMRVCFLVLLLMFYSGRLLSQTADDQARPLRFDVTPLVGYRTIMSFPTGQDQDLLPLVFDAKPSYGISAGMRLDEEDLIEIRWARQNSYVHLQGAAPAQTEKVILDQFHGDFTHEFILDNWHSWARPFVMGSIGATRIAGGANNSFTRFSFGLGGGLKVYFTRHVGFRVQAEWLPIVVNPAVGSVVCGGGCIVQLSSTVVSQGEIAVGPVFRF